MDKKIKAKWLKALRSGDYDQTEGALCRVLDTGAAYCCIGVLVEIVRGEDIWEDTAIGSTALAMGNGPRYTPNESFYGEVGIKEGYDESLGRKTISKVIALNDNGKSFEEIAEVIEKEL